MGNFEFVIKDQEQYDKVIGYLGNCEELVKSEKEGYVTVYNSGNESLTIDASGDMDIEVHVTENFPKEIRRGLIKVLHEKAA